ncbi:hypothetical protein ABZS76_33215 [Streptomyces sp. NPDC005562]|uniref:hypothetical protein n=1 Tax=Streptomyces sp. NPDC005562 TaxID=3154890 RepID=UPI0033B9CCAB
MSDTYGTYDPADRPGRKAATPQAQPTLTAEDGTELPAFDERSAEAFTGLLYLGSLTESFSWLGHDFVIRTLGVDEQLAVAQVTKQYEGTGGGEQLAYATAVVAMAIVTVDGEELPTPIGEDAKLAEWAHKRFGYVKSNWFQYTISEVFQRYLKLEDTAAQTVAAMGKAFGPTVSTPG